MHIVCYIDSMKKKITSSDIAKLANVSQSTVSRALSPGKAWMISQEKREEIFNLCRKYSYLPQKSTAPVQLRKTYKIGFLLGSMEQDLTAAGFSFMLRELCDCLQSFNYTLTLIRIDYSSPKLAQNVNRILKSNIVDIYIAGAGMLRGQTIDFLHSMSSRLISYIPFCAPVSIKNKHNWISTVIHDHESAFRKLVQTIPEKLLYSAIYLGEDETDNWKNATIRQYLTSHYKKSFKFANIMLDKGKTLRDRSYRSAYALIDKIYPALQGHKLYFCGGSLLAQALSDYLKNKGLQIDRDFFIVTFGIFSKLTANYDYEPDSFSAFGYRAESAARRIAELAMELTENPLPRKIMIPIHFIPSPAFGGTAEKLI